MVEKKKTSNGRRVLLCSGSGLDEIMTLEEKEKLYTAIGYSGSSHNLALPKHVTLTSCLLDSFCFIFQHSPKANV